MPADTSGNIAEGSKSSALVEFDAPELKDIESSRAQQIKDIFVPMAKMLKDFEGRYEGVVLDAEEEITKDVCATAKSLRIAISKVRIAGEKARKEQKEKYLRAGKAIDGVSNILRWAVTEKENKLSEIEKHFESLEQEKLQALQAERVAEISPYLKDAHERTFSDMDEDVWKAYFTSKKKEFDDRVAAEKTAEANRLAQEKADADERDRVTKENERLKAEVKERERVADIERKKREDLEAALKLKAETEEARVQADLNKGDAAKVQDLITDLWALKTKYSFESEKNQEMYSRLSSFLDNAVNHVRESIS